MQDNPYCWFIFPDIDEQIADIAEEADSSEDKE